MSRYKSDDEIQSVVREYNQRLNSLSYCTDSIDKDKATKYAERIMFYLKRPFKGVAFASGPYDALIQSIMIMRKSGRGFGCSVPITLDHIHHFVCDDVIERLTSVIPFNSTLFTSLDPLPGIVRNKISSRLDDMFYPYMKENTERIQLCGFTDLEVREIGAWGFVCPFLDGQFFAYWMLSMDCFKALQGIPVIENWQVYDQLEFGFVYPLDEYVVISERPLVFSIKDNAIHKDGGPAVAYRDGFRFWSLNGVTVPQWLAESTSATIDISLFKQLNDAKVIHEFIQKFGIERILPFCTIDIVDKKGKYELINVKTHVRQVHTIPYLKVHNESTNTWHLVSVDPYVTKIGDAISCIRDEDIR